MEKIKLKPDSRTPKTRSPMSDRGTEEQELSYNLVRLEVEERGPPTSICLKACERRQ